MNWIEITGFVLTILGVFLSIYQSIWVWPVNIVSPIVYLIIFYKAKLYGDMSLQLLFIGLAVYGGVLWSRQDMRPKKAVRFLNVKEYFIYSLSTIILSAAFYFVLDNYTDTDVPLSDAVLTAASIIATILAAKKCIENWAIWVLADLAYTALYIYKGLYLTAVLYFILAVLAVYGYYSWKREIATK
ncbi:MAG TPA: nicotinamide riboside transporter PnuC [Bacteroidia bacterium]